MENNNEYIMSTPSKRVKYTVDLNGIVTVIHSPYEQRILDKFIKN